MSEILCHRNKHIFKEGVIYHFEIFFFGSIEGLVFGYLQSFFCLFSFLDWCLNPLVYMFSIKNK